MRELVSSNVFARDGECPALSEKGIVKKENLVQSFSRWVVICDCDLGDCSLTGSDFRW